MDDLKQKLIDWCYQYETTDFINNDPVQFPRHFCVDTDYGRIMTDKRNVEISGLITSWLSYGNRKQIIKVLTRLHIFMDWRPIEYLQGNDWETYKDSTITLYRFNVENDYYQLLRRLNEIYKHYSDLEQAVLDIDNKDYVHALQVLFEGINGIPAPGKNSACKRLSMFLRWMVRRDSSVDMGIWTRCEPDKLLIPLDTHVHKQALNLGITQRKSADIKTAREITNYFNDIFPGDPAKGDFALFGYGVNS